MALAKSKGKTQKSKVKAEKPVEIVESEITSSEDKPMVSSLRPSKAMLIGAVIIGITLLAIYKKDWFVAGTVNGTPITNFEVLNKINSQYRKSTLDQMVNEKILLQEATKKGVVIKNAEIDAKIAEIEAKMGGAQGLDSALAQQGQTRQGIRDQIKLQLIIEKLYKNEATVSAKEVEDFVAQNGAQLSSSDSAEQTKEATDILTQQKLSQVFSQKFQELKTAAKIQLF